MGYDKALDCLGDPTRRIVLERLRAGPWSVGEIARTVPIRRPAVSQHLAVLKEAGLVRHQSVGTRRLYYVNLKALSAVRAWFDRFSDQALLSYQREVARRIQYEENKP